MRTFESQSAYLSRRGLLTPRELSRQLDFEPEVVDDSDAAMAERRYLRQFDDGESYCTFEQSARSAKAGMWNLSPGQRVAPWEWRRRKNRTTPFTDYRKATVASDEH